MLVDKVDLGFGRRSWRYLMLVDNGVITKNPKAEVPHDVLMFTKPGCGYCTKAKKLLADCGWAYDEVPATPRRLRAVSGKTTTPQVFVDGKYIGGATEIEAYLGAR